MPQTTEATPSDLVHVDNPQSPSNSDIANKSDDLITGIHVPAICARHEHPARTNLPDLVKGERYVSKYILVNQIRSLTSIP